MYLCTSAQRAVAAWKKKYNYCSSLNIEDNNYTAILSMTQNPVISMPSAEIREAYVTELSSQEAESSGQKCSVESMSNQMLFLAHQVDMNRCIHLTGNKLLYVLKRGSTSPAFNTQGERTEKHTRFVFWVSIPLSVSGCRGRSKHCHVLATGPDRRNSSCHKNSGCRPYNRDTL